MYEFNNSDAADGRSTELHEFFDRSNDQYRAGPRPVTVTGSLGRAWSASAPRPNRAGRRPGTSGERTPRRRPTSPERQPPVPEPAGVAVHELDVNPVDEQRTSAEPRQASRAVAPGREQRSAARVQNRQGNHHGCRREWRTTSANLSRTMTARRWWALPTCTSRATTSNPPATATDACRRRSSRRSAVVASSTPTRRTGKYETRPRKQREGRVARRTGAGTTAPRSAALSTAGDVTNDRRHHRHAGCRDAADQRANRGAWRRPPRRSTARRRSPGP